MATTIAGLAGSATAAAGRRATATRDEFLKVMVAELTSQDPLEPLSSADFVQQIAALQNLEQTAALTDGLNSFQRFLQMASGSALIGRTVKGTTADGEAVEGVVTRVTLENGQVIVVAGDRELPLDSVTEIRPATA